MKKFISIILVTLLSGLNFLFAQEKNQIILEGSLGYTSNNSFFHNSMDRERTSTLSFSHSAGIMLGNRVALGAFLGYQVYSNEDDRYRKYAYRTHTLDYGIYTRIHVKLMEKLTLYIQPYFSKSEINDNIRGEYYELNIGTSTGLLFFFTPKFSLNLHLNDLRFNYASEGKYFDEEHYQDFTIETALNSPKIGVSFYL
ncbi:hypothetical protein [Flammeovirga aprica]|uniref:Outer membrane protein beta-barrel domain-containing protein n=1 Tax=Flammeovirga aprica JL-4 TaxID=694437 RepID=A0A7X9XB82_9BACT|nr:hypothetical protein [Flammeovirga aprica]NME70467.1 hypothetical protein [Flammeovirga aprica JL-4]